MVVEAGGALKRFERVCVWRLRCLSCVSIQGTDTLVDCARLSKTYVRPRRRVIHELMHLDSLGLIWDSYVDSPCLIRHGLSLVPMSSVPSGRNIGPTAGHRGFRQQSDRRTEHASA